MRDEKEYKSKAMWKTNKTFEQWGVKCGIIKLPTGAQGSVVVGRNEEGWEHVSLSLYRQKLPTWDEMCYIKNIFWDEEEEVVQIHPKKSKYVDLTEALHLWRPVNGDWSLMNRG